MKSIDSSFATKIPPEDLEAARASLPESLRQVDTAVRIQAFLHLTRSESQASGGPSTVSVIVPSEDLEPLLVSGFVRLEHLVPLQDERHLVLIEEGELRDTLHCDY